MLLDYKYCLTIFLVLKHYISAMKKIILSAIAVIGLASFANAQLKPEAGSKGFGFRINGIANTAFSNWGRTGLSGQTINDPLGVLAPGTTVDDLVPQEMFFGRYYISSDLALRVGLGINSISMKSNTVDSVAGATAITTTDSKTSAFSFGLNVGVEKHFASAAEKLDPYAGAQLGFSSLGSIKNETSSNTNTDPAVSSTSTTTWAGGSAFGFDLLGGFNFFFTDNFALGAEFSWGFHSANIGGDYTMDASSTVGSTTVNTQAKGSAKTGTSGFRVGSTAGVNASVFF
jgi:hypothetical protein